MIRVRIILFYLFRGIDATRPKHHFHLSLTSLAQDDSIAIEATIAYLSPWYYVRCVRNILNIWLAALRDAAACRDNIDEITDQRGYRTRYNVHCIMRFVINAFKRDIYIYIFRIKYVHRANDFEISLVS